MAETMDLTPQSEDYLEAIFQAIAQKGIARAGEISRRLSVHKSTVTAALKGLAEKGLVDYTPYAPVTLTAAGRRVAEEVVRRHEVLRDFLVRVLAVAEKDADAAACKMEHAIPEAILEQFIGFLEFVERCPRGGAKWIKGFGYYCDSHETMGNCEKCVQLVLDEIRSKQVAKTEETQTETTLATIRPGGKAAIVKVEGKGGTRRRLLDMGATAGTLVEVERVAPLGDPVEVKIKGYHLSLRREEAERIRVKAV
jgi:DtxR family Mn-dependent transcriptional regulator